MGRAGRVGKIAQVLLGPATFPLDRLLAIFSAICPEPNVDVITWSQVASLRGLGFIRGTGSGNQAGLIQSGWERMRCNVEKRVVERVAHGLGFRLDYYLHTT